MSNAPREDNDTPRPVALDVLIAEYEHIGEMFRWNEETGERRVTIILSIITAGAAAAGLLFTRELSLPPESKARMAGGVLLALLALGVVTLGRLVRRNVSTDEYKWALDEIRGRLIELDPDRLRGYRPFPPGRNSAFKRFLGLTLLVAAMNSVIAAGALLLLLPPPSSLVGIALGIAAFLGTAALQLWGARVLETHLRTAVGLQGGSHGDTTA